MQKFLKTAVADGVDGFRYDAAKHVELPTEVFDNKQSNYWNTILKNGSQFQYGEVLGGLTFSMTKAERLLTRESTMNHCMMFCGVNLDENGKPNRWRVENSWGKEPGKDGYYLMTDRWFDEYMYQVVVNKKYLTPEQLAAYNAEPIALEPWDPMGSLAKAL